MIESRPFNVSHILVCTSLLCILSSSIQSHQLVKHTLSNIRFKLSLVTTIIYANTLILHLNNIYSHTLLSTTMNIFSHSRYITRLQKHNYKNGTLSSSSTNTYDDPGNYALKSQEFQLHIWNNTSKQTYKTGEHLDYYL